MVEFQLPTGGTVTTSMVGAICFLCGKPVNGEFVLLEEYHSGKKVAICNKCLSKLRNMLKQPSKGDNEIGEE